MTQKWYQIASIGRKWHLLNNKCYTVRSVWGHNPRMQELDLKARENAVVPTLTPAWSKIPLPDTAMSRICKRCFKKAASRLQ